MILTIGLEVTGWILICVSTWVGIVNLVSGTPSLNGLVTGGLGLTCLGLARLSKGQNQ